MKEKISCPLSKEEFYGLYHAQNVPEREICKMFSVTTSVIKRWREEYEIPPKTKEEIAEMRAKSNIENGNWHGDGIDEKLLFELYIVQNKSESTIAKGFNIPIDRVKYLVNKFSLKKDKKQRYDSLGWKEKNQREKLESTLSLKKRYDEILTKDILLEYIVVNKMSNKDISKKFGIPIGSVKARIKRYGIKRDRELITEVQQRKKISDDIYDFLHDRNRFVEFVKENKNISAVELSKKIGIETASLYRYLDKYDMRSVINRFSSSKEKEVSDFLDSIGVKYTKDRSVLAPFEIDFYCPDHKIGIEFNGIYWHSSLFKEKNYHFNKSKEAEKLGIRLIHIYECEWNDERIRPILESMLKIAFGKISSKIYARDCVIKEITNVEARPFNNANHLQGHRNAQVTYGLFYNGDLVQLMSFSKHKKYQWEIIRGCPGSNNIVIGGVSRLFKHFVRSYNPDQVFSYADFNKFDGSGYLGLGMEFIGYTGPDMSWIIDGEVVHRQPSKHKELSKIAEATIWGAGSKKFLWKKQ